MSTMTEVIGKRKTAADELAEKAKEGEANMRLTLKAVEEMGSAANKVLGLVRLIEDIAAKTNILALNAAVEAQRAGTAGQGFAVVADEVRTLAGKVTGSTRDIQALMDETGRSTAEGERLAQDMNRMLRTVAGHIQEVEQSAAHLKEQAARQEALMNAIHDKAGELLRVAKTLHTAGDTIVILPDD